MSTTGNNMGQLLSGSRSVFALAENGDLPPVFARVHPEFRTPYVAIWFTTIVLVALALSGSFVFLAAVSAVARLVIYLSTCVATLWLRRPSQAGRVAPAHVHRAVRPGDSGGGDRIIALSILAGATTQQLLSGVAALVVGAVLYALAGVGARRVDAA